MIEVTLKVELRSAATFGRGDGVAGLVDREVSRDRHGFPFLRGRTLKGLLAESAEDVVFALERQGQREWVEVKERLFGHPGSGLTGDGSLRVGDARLPKNLQNLLLAELANGTISASEIFSSLTGVRRQTAINQYGGPERGSLRSMRVILRGLTFEAALIFRQDPLPDDWALLTAAVLGLRHAGTARNRGRGWVRGTLVDEETMKQHFARFRQGVAP